MEVMNVRTMENKTAELYGFKWVLASMIRQRAAHKYKGAQAVKQPKISNGISNVERGGGSGSQTSAEREDFKALLTATFY
jgi:hypothetical protein